PVRTACSCPRPARPPATAGPLHRPIIRDRRDTLGLRARAATVAAPRARASIRMHIPIVRPLRAARQDAEVHTCVRLRIDQARPRLPLVAVHHLVPQVHAARTEIPRPHAQVGARFTICPGAVHAAASGSKGFPAARSTARRTATGSSFTLYAL